VRNAVVTISESAHRYRIVVEMLAVKAFDPPTNRRLNLQKARGLAMQALAKHLSLGNPSRFTVSGVEIQDSRTTNSSYRLALSVPRDGISAAGGDTPESALGEKGTGRGSRSVSAAAKKPGSGLAHEATSRIRTSCIRLLELAAVRLTLVEARRSRIGRRDIASQDRVDIRPGVV
jgi:hypothetical protein